MNQVTTFIGADKKEQHQRRAMVNGIELVCSWVPCDLRYEVYFPTMEDQIIPLDQSQKFADEVFEFMCESAEKAENVDVLATKTFEYVLSYPEELDDCNQDLFEVRSIS